MQGTTVIEEVRMSAQRAFLQYNIVSLRDKKNFVELNLALHESWQDTQDVVQPAIWNHKARASTSKPTRLYDVQQQDAISGTGNEHYLALSYSWSEWEDEALRAKLAELSTTLGVRHFWVDRWCIDQHDERDKAREIPCMGDYYSGAGACLVLTGPSAKPFKCVPRQSGVILSAFQQVSLNSVAIESLVQSRWADRVWTLQEALMARQVIYAHQGQLIDGDFVSELLAYINSATFVIVPGCGWFGGYGCYRWSPALATVIAPRQFSIQKDGKVALLRSVFGGEIQHQELSRRGSTGRVLMPFEDAIALVNNRAAFEEQDFVYGVLGISEGGQDITPEYNITWQMMLDKLTRAGMITERQLASSEPNTRPGMLWTIYANGSTSSTASYASIVVV
ncbi:hypothetical protein ACQRIT_001106 [Beauveria bassiana]